VLEFSGGILQKNTRMEVLTNALKSTPELEVVETPQGKKSILVIGAGASGLTVMKELKELGHTPICIEENMRIGGVYTKSYDRTMLTTSSLLTAYSDYSDGREDRPVFWSDEEYLDYLDGFATKFKLYENIHFRSSVLSARRDLDTNKWHVTVALGGAYVWPHRSSFLLGRSVAPGIATEAKKHGAQVLKTFHQLAEAQGFNKVKSTFSYDYYDHITGEKLQMIPGAPPSAVKTYVVDSLAVCTGTNTWAVLPSFDGQEEFIAGGGTIVHAEDYKKPEVYRNKRVLIVGAGESGSDICKEIADEAAKVAIVVRGKHGHLIPRKQADGRVTDLNTNRCRYSNPYIFGDWVGYVNQVAKKFAAKHGLIPLQNASERAVLQKIGELNMYQGTSAFSKFGCKNEGFVTAMVVKGAELHRDSFTLSKRCATFKDGSQFSDLDDVIACTGYKNSFPMFCTPQVADEIIHKPSNTKHKDIDPCYGKNPRALYKQIFCPLFTDGALAFFGFARPAFGSIPPTAEMQAKFFALVTDGQIELPPTEKMQQIAKKDECNWATRFGYDAKRVKGLVDYQLYLDDLAKEMGCLPPLTRIFFSSPRLWFKVMYGPLNTLQYRFVGPFQNLDRIKEVYAKMPVGDFLECSITTVFLITAKFLSLLGFKRFQPNNF